MTRRGVLWCIVAPVLFGVSSCTYPPPKPMPAPAPIPAAPQTPRVVVEHETCALFRPVYLTAAEVQALSRETLSRIVGNNNEGQRLCGWKPNISGDSHAAKETAGGR